MARRQVHTARTSNRRVNSTTRPERYHYLQETYEDGNAVRILEPEYEEYREETIREAKPDVSERTKKNRARAKSMGAGYVLFLAAVCVCSVFLCIHYLQLRSELTNQMETIASMENTLSKLQADNDAYYKQAQASVSLEDVRDTALNKLGMHYATESQIIYYNADNESYVRQYESVSNQ